MEIWIGVILMAVIALVTTANVAMRHLSRVQLTERLEKKGKVDWIDRFSRLRDELIFCSAIVRVGAILALVLLIADIFGAAPQAEPVSQYATIFITAALVIMIVGVAIPSAWARYGGIGFLAVTLPALFAMRYLLYPLLALEHLMDSLVRRLAGVPLTSDKQSEVDQIEKEILEAVTEGELAGAVHEEDADMIESVMEFRDKDVAEIMTPRTEMQALPATSTLIEAKEFIVREGHSRIPVYVDNIDDIKGVLYAKDLLTIEKHEVFDPLKFMRKVPFVPETKRIPDLLAELKEKKVHLAIVVDEYGGTAGLVTIEDIIEEIVGEIADEYEPAEPEPIQRIDAQTLDVDARVHIDELNEELHIELPEDKDYDTVGGFLFSEMGKIPVAGEEMHYQNVRFRILDAEERKINRLRVEIIPEKTEA